MLSEELPSKEELKVIHKTIKKVEEDIERYAFNTSVSTFMICVNELSALKCNKRSVLENLLVILSPYAPHIAEELWVLAGHQESIVQAPFPKWEEAYIKEDDHEYPVSINGKMRTKLSFGLDMPKDAIEKEVLANETVLKWLEGKPPKKSDHCTEKKIINVVM